MRRLWVGVIVAGFMFTATPAVAKPSKACAEALRRADRVAELFAGYVVAHIESDGSSDSALRAKFDLLAIQDQGVKATDAYKAAARRCRK